MYLGYKQYAYRSGFIYLNANIQKSIRIDRYTYDVIDDFNGTGFSDKLREYVRIMELARNHHEFNRILDESINQIVSFKML